MWSYAKIAAIFIVFGLSTISGIFSCLTVKCLVSKFGKSQKFKRALGLMNCFAGGVFFATCILDIVPEAREDMEAAKEHWGWTTEYPLTEVLMGIGFLLILTLEHGAHTCFQSRNPEKTTLRDHPAVIPRLTSNEKTTSQTTVFYSSSKVNHEPQNHVKKNDNIITGESNGNSYFDDVKYNASTAVDGSIDKATSPDHRTNNGVKITLEDSDKIEIKHEAVVPSDDVITTSAALESLSKSETKRINLRGLVLLIALSLHMIFDGLSLGLLEDNSKVWHLLLALSIHKVLVFFTIGLQVLELLKSLPKTIFVICAFALVSPIGTIIGESINSNSDQSTQDVASAILQGIAAGTFLYVTFFEILQQEFQSSGHDLLKVFCTIIGFSVIGASRLLENEDAE